MHARTGQPRLGSDFKLDHLLENDGRQTLGELSVGLEGAQFVHHVGGAAVHLVDLLAAQENVEAAHPQLVAREKKDRSPKKDRRQLMREIIGAKRR